jgi:hypothetical protein
MTPDAAEWKRLLLSGAPLAFAAELPPEEKTFPAAWIQEAAAANARIEVRGAILSGVLNVHQIEFTENVRMDSCTFQDSAGFPRCTFAKNLSICNCTFQKDVDFSAAIIRGNADISASVFSSNGANFSDFLAQGVFTAKKMKFPAGAKADFPRARFEASLLALESEFGGEMNFVGAEIKGHAGFNGCRFLGKARFNSATIGGNAVFHADPDIGVVAATFADEVDFIACSIGGTICFDGVTFTGEGKSVSFNIARIAKNALLRNCPFAGTVNFFGVHVGETATLQGAVFQQSTTFALACISGSFYLSQDKDSGFQGAVFQNEANFWGFSVEGPADFTGAQFLAKDRVAQFGNARFGSSVNFCETVFQGSVGLAGTRTAGDAYFQNAHFGCPPGDKTTQDSGPTPQSADFSMARFGASANFTGVIFEGATFFANFMGVHIAGNATFFGCRFDGPVDFTTAEIGGTAGFQGAIFQGAASFNTAIMRGLANFRAEPELNLKAASFAGDANFVGVNFGDTADFSSVQFLAKDKIVLFGNARFHSLVHFYGAVFQGSVNIAGAQIAGDAHFQNTHFGSAPDAETDTTSKPAMRDADFSMARFGSSVNFASAVFEGPSLRANFTAAHITGNATFSGCRFDGPADFTTAIIGGAAAFQGAVFQGTTSFNTTVVRGLANFRAWPERNLRPATFAEEANFVGVTFGETADFTAAHFQGKQSALLLDSAKFSHNAFFSGACFEGPSTFVGASFEGATYFQAVRFALGAQATFRGARFAQGAYFQYARFGGAATFEMAFYGMEANFSGAEFHLDAKFNGSQFAGMAHFDPTIDEKFCTLGPLFHLFSCDHARFERDAHFEGACFTQPASFRETSFRSLHFQAGEEADVRRRFEDTVDFRGCTYERIDVRWQSILLREEMWDTAVAADPLGRRLPAPLQRRVCQPPVRQTPYDRQPYAQLEARLRSAGLDGVADDVYLERCRVERAQASFRAHPSRWIGRHVYKWVANCGVQPIRLAVFALLLVAGGTAVFSQPGAVVPVAPEKNSKTSMAAPPPAETQLGRAEAFGVSLHQFLPVDVPLGDEWKPAQSAIEVPLGIGAMKPHVRVNPTVYATFFLRLAGWILVPLGVAALTGLLRHSSDS